MQRFRTTILLVIPAMLLLLCWFPLAAEDEKKGNGVASKTRQILKQRCWRCHNGENSTGGSFDILDDADLVESGRIEKGSPDDSYLFEMVIKNRMPPKAVTERVTAEEGNVIRQWILDGTPPFPKAKQREFVSASSVLTSIRDYLRKADRHHRSYLRFFTLHNLHNNPRFFESDLENYRAALSKTVNSLSWNQRITIPKAIDPLKLVYVIDTRDYHWDSSRNRQDKWEEILKQYPYGLKYRNLPDEILMNLDEEIIELTQGCDLSYVRADWFITNGTRPPLYHTLLEIPNSAKTLEHRLGVNVARNFLNPHNRRVSRAGFARSGVSGQNRLLERHESTHGFYWKSYDFKPDRFRAKLTRFPLGPLNMFQDNHHPFRSQAFIHDGGEIIFSLPNGLQGYMLTDGKDDRIDVGPIEVVSDNLKTSGTPEIVNGVSCMSCHRNGMLWFKDTIRNHSAVFGEPEKHVKRLFPEISVMDELIQEDQDHFLKSLEKCIGPILLKGDNSDADIEDLPEPVGEVARVHRLQFLDLKTVACELDIEDPQQLLIKVGEKNLKKLGLESLLKKGGVINRLEWEATEGVSLMQELARELRYTPFRAL
jgi:mono/diheme cytochrome c family protein